MIGAQWGVHELRWVPSYSWHCAASSARKLAAMGAGTEFVGKVGLDVSGLPSGIYWVRDVDSGSGQVFVKE